MPPQTPEYQEFLTAFEELAPRIIRGTINEMRKEDKEKKSWTLRQFAEKPVRAVGFTVAGGAALGVGVIKAASALYSWAKGAPEEQMQAAASFIGGGGGLTRRR